MSYTLRGRLDSRLVALLPVLLVAGAVAASGGHWWPIELALLMVAVGIVLDVQLYDRVLDYQPGWLALPLGLLELGLLMGLTTVLGIDAPLWPAIALFLAGWLLAQALAHAGFPLLRLTYAEDGGELGAVGVLAAASVVAVIAGASVVAWVTRPPVVHLDAGVHQGPIVITRSQILDGEPGAVVEGGIVIRADDVTVRDVSVAGGANGIDVEDSDHVVLERVSVSGATLDGIHVRRSSVAIRDCSIDSRGNAFAQGIDMSFSFDRRPSSVVGCTVTGGQEGIVTHFMNAMISGNHVVGTTHRGIAMTEMSMGMIEHNEVRGALGVGIFCNDMSMCHIERNTVVGTRRDPASGNRWRDGYAVLVSYHAEAELRDNALSRNPHGVGVAMDSHVRHDGS
jgi:Right handed beta helix region